MITNFKIFEHTTNFEPEFNSCWVTYGNLKKVVEILKQIKIDSRNQKQFNIDNIIKDLEKNIWRNKYKNSIGTIIYCHNGLYNHNITYDTFNNNIEKEIRINKNNFINFKGEIKLENGKIVLDTLEADTKKYNL